MPMGRGYFMDLRTWELIPIAEHHHAVRSNPKRYRVTLKELPKDRDQAIAKVLEKDFARIRATVDGLSWQVEVDRSWDDAYGAALAVGQEEKLPKHATFQFFVVKDSQHSPLEVSYADVLKETLGECVIRTRGIHRLTERAYEKKKWSVQCDKAVEVAMARSKTYRGGH
jgi:hypothetical protein